MEVFIGSGIALFTMYAAAKWQDNPQKKLNRIFENVGYKAGDKQPRFKRKIKHHDNTEYIFSVPSGLVDDPKLQPTIEKTFCKPVEITFDGRLHVRIYNQKLPQRIKYDWGLTQDYSVPIGQTYSGMLYHDFDKVPHMTVAGMTRQGKTVLLKLMLTHLIRNNPNNIEVFIIDLKGGLEFGWCDNLKQVNQVASNVIEAQECLQEVIYRMKGDMSYFKGEGYTNILDTKIKKRTFIIVDEGAELTPPAHLDKEEKNVYKYCQYALSEIARIGGALGYRNIFATQYPTADTLPREIKQNADAKISFRLPTEIASRVAIDEQGAELLPCPGRAIYKSVNKYEVQVPYLTNSEIKSDLKEWFRDTNATEDKQTGKDTFQIG